VPGPVLSLKNANNFYPYSLDSRYFTNNALCNQYFSETTVSSPGPNPCVSSTLGLKYGGYGGGAPGYPHGDLGHEHQRHQWVMMERRKINL
jgi:hypothetical protein